MPSTIEHIDNPNYLGDQQVVAKLLREFIYTAISTKAADAQAFAAEMRQNARKTARIFLGRDSHYPSPPWNSPGQLDGFLAKECGLADTDPELRVMTALAKLLVEHSELMRKVADEKLIKEQWEWDADRIFTEYTNLFMGLPREGLEPADPSTEE